MSKEKFNINVSEVDNGYRIEITGDEAKELIKSKIAVCCSDGSNLSEIFSSCCQPKE